MQLFNFSSKSWGGSASPRTAQSWSRALGFGNCPSVWCVPSPALLCSTAFATKAKVGFGGAWAAKSRGPLFPAATSNSALPWDAAGNSLGAQGGLQVLTRALQGGGIAGGMLQRPKGSWALVPAHEHRKDKVCGSRDGGRCLHHNRS